MQPLPTSTRALVLAGVTVLLAACGGGGSGDSVAAAPAPPPTVPTSATTSVASLIAYLQQLMAGSDETSAPVLLGDATLPTSDSDNATALP